MEVDKRDGEIIIYDNKSMNHTWKENKKLKPLVRYQLSGGEKLKFGSVCATLQIHSSIRDASTENSTFLGQEKGIYTYIYIYIVYNLYCYLNGQY